MTDDELDAAIVEAMVEDIDRDREIAALWDVASRTGGALVTEDMPETSEPAEDDEPDLGPKSDPVE